VLRLLVRLRATQFRDKECRPPNVDRSFAHRNCIVSLIDAGTHRMNRFISSIEHSAYVARGILRRAVGGPKNLLSARLTDTHGPETRESAARKLPYGKKLPRSFARSEDSLELHASGGLLPLDSATAENECGVCLKTPDPLAFDTMHPPVLAHVGKGEIFARFKQRSASSRNQFMLTRSVAARPIS
jgi:hypothetical protein